MYGVVWLKADEVAPIWRTPAGTKKGLNEGPGSVKSRRLTS
jgi:hypothetical protein